MTTLTVTSKGQVTLRKDVLEHLGVSPGEQISVEKLPDGRIERKNGPTLSIEQMNEIARQGWSGRTGKKK
jgi:AbrB family looped-hinge helix DNA binding protein